MPSLRAHLAMQVFGAQKRALLAHPDNTRIMRRLFEGGTRLVPPPSRLDVMDARLNSVRTDRLVNRRIDRKKGTHLFYIHGGGFVVGSPRSHRAWAGRLGQRAGVESIWLPDYRLAPEHRFPAALDDVLSAWEALCGQYPDDRKVLAGDSAGGNLSVALCVAARDRGLPLPSAVYLQSPWLDLTLSSHSHDRQDGRDPFLGTFFLERDFARHYAHGTHRKHPLLSPLHAELHDLPPCLVQVGTREVLLDDSRHFVQKVREAGGQATLDVWRGLWHAWPQVPLVPESRQAMAQAGDWLALATRL
jgi:monoterpene epsilon-lactone hydrolase